MNKLTLLHLPTYGSTGSVRDSGTVSVKHQDKYKLQACLQTAAYLCVICLKYNDQSLTDGGSSGLCTYQTHQQLDTKCKRSALAKEILACIFVTDIEQTDFLKLININTSWYPVLLSFFCYLIFNTMHKTIKCFLSDDYYFL